MGPIFRHRGSRQPMLGALLGLALVGACSDKPESEPAAVTDTATNTDPDTVLDAVQSDVPLPLDCPGGTGCPCKAAGDCDTAKCIETPVGRVCAGKCVDSCPPGFSCLASAGGGDDVNWCTPTWGLLCRPCDGDSTCATLGVDAPFCVDYEGQGSFCGAACETNDDCPLQYGCEIVKSAEGHPGRQCVRLHASDAAFGTCPCSKAASSLLMKTTCWLPDKDDNGQVVGRCKGHRTCAASGLNVCTLYEGPAALCVDTQCENKADGSSCDDGDPCTQTDACAAGTCQGSDDTCACHKSADCAALEDGNPCTGTLYCDTKVVPHVCKANPATVISCSAADDTACQKNSCQPTTAKCAMTPLTEGAPCPTNVKCMKGACDGQGECALALACACTQDADCADAEDGDACNGTLFCNTNLDSPTCEVHPATVVMCKTVGDTGCLKNTCQPTTGDCAMVSLPDATTCSDGDPCTTGDACATGKCAPGTSTCVCSKDADCAAKDDGDLCNGIQFCNQAVGVCQHNPATEVTCQVLANSSCAVSKCVPKLGKCALSPISDGVGCDDDNPCTDGDLCATGACKPGTNTCTCASDADCVKKDDGNLCNGTLYCAKGDGGGACKPGGELLHRGRPPMCPDPLPAQDRQVRPDPPQRRPELR